MAGHELYISEMLEELQGVLTSVKDSINGLVESTQIQVDEMKKVAAEIKDVSLNTGQVIEYLNVEQAQLDTEHMEIVFPKVDISTGNRGVDPKFTDGSIFAWDTNVIFNSLAKGTVRFIAEDGSLTISKDSEITYAPTLQLKVNDTYHTNGSIVEINPGDTIALSIRGTMSISGSVWKYWSGNIKAEKAKLLYNITTPTKQGGFTPVNYQE